MLTCCNNSTFQYIQRFADMRKYYQKLFNPTNIASNNINSTLKLKRKFVWCDVKMKSKYYLKFSTNVFMIES